MLVLSHHYSSPFDYHEKTSPLEAANSFLGIARLLKLFGIGKKSSGAVRIGQLLQSTETAFGEALDNDFNMPDALASLHELISGIFQFTKTNGPLNKSEAAAAKNLIVGKMKMLGFNMKPVIIPPKIKQRAKQREAKRKNKDFAGADSSSVE